MFNEYVVLDENVAVCGEISDQDILAEVLNKKDGDSSGEEEEKQLEAEEISSPSSSEALRHLSEFCRYVEGKPM